MIDDVAIRVENLSKTFKLPHERVSSVKAALINLTRHKKGYELQHVLKDISFEIKKGEFVGIVGRNGSGKSTLLKLLAGIYEPTKGSIRVNGKLTPFIELGVGFNPELTGRENVFLNGALLGFSRKEMLAMYGDIVSFAELERFMDQKLKNYSSGMQVRLAFSIAIRAKSEILVLDEVLAVGDGAFQAKCIDVFESYKAEKKTVILVTHDMETVKRFCSTAILIDDGRIRYKGDPIATASKYLELNMAEETARLRKSDQSQGLQLEIKIPKNQKPAFKTGDSMTVRLSWPSSMQGVKNAGVAIIKNSGEYIYGANTLSLKNKISSNRTDYKIKLNVTPGKYFIKAGIFGKTDHEVIEFVEQGPEFIVNPDPKDLQAGLVRLEDQWVTK